MVAAAMRIYCRRNKRMTYALKRSQIVKNDYSLLNYGFFRSSMFSFASLQKLIVSWLFKNKIAKRKLMYIIKRTVIIYLFIFFSVISGKV